MAPSTRRLFLALLGLSVLCACASGTKKQVTQVPGLKAHLIAVYPFGFRWPEPAYRSFEVSERLIRTALGVAGDKVAFLGPGELKVFKPEDDHVWVATDLVTTLSALGVDRNDVLVLRPWAERLVESSRQEAASASGKTVRANATEEVTYRGHVEVLHPGSDTRVVDLSADQKVDPFAVHEDDSDPAPELTLLMEKLTKEALEALDASIAPPTAPHVLTLNLLFNPEAALDYGEPGRPALRGELATKDAIEGEVLRINRIRYANPGLTDAEAAKLSRLPGGMVVRTTSGRFDAMDVITTVNGQPALPQTIARARFSRTPVQVRVRRASGDWGEFLLF